MEPTIDKTHDIYISRADLFKWLAQFDPSASVLSYMKVWDSFANEAVRSSCGFLHLTWAESEPTFRIKFGEANTAIRKIVEEIKYGAFQSLDEKDEDLRHLFDAEITPPTPRMDVQGRLVMAHDEELRIIAEALKQLPGILQRIFEEQSIARITAEQNKLALEDVEEKIEQLMGPAPMTFAEMADHSPSELRRLMGLPQPPQADPERTMTMAEKLVKAATETSTGVLSAIQEGGKISLSQKANKGVVEVFHKHLGHHIPGATSPVGKKIEAIAIPSILHFGAAMLADKVPHVDVIQRACLRAITGESKDGMDGIVEALMPVFQEILAGEGIVGEAVKEMSKAEPQIAATPASPQLPAGETQALMAAFLEQMENAKPGETVEIKITLPARPAEPKQLVPPFEP